MKYFSLIALLALALVGCSKQDSGGQVTDDAKKAAGSTVDAARQAMDAGKAAAEKTVAEAGGRAQELIDKAKSLVAENKFQDAAPLLQQLGGMKLTDDQQKLVDGLKEQIQKALANKATGEASSAVGNLLGGKK